MKRGLLILCCVIIEGLFTLSDGCFAQMVIIPQEIIQEAANPSTIGKSVMLFEEGSKVSFGTIGEDSEPWRTRLHWRSSEGQKVTITHIKTSCGCLVAKWDRRQSTNATSGTMEVEYRPKGHMGGIVQRIFIYTTLSESKPTAIVEIVGKVEPSADHSSLYPHIVGTLGLRTVTLRMPADGGMMEIAAMNCGSQPLRVTHDERMSIGGVRAYTLPEVLQSGEEGVLVVEFKPTYTQPMLFLGGVSAPPRQRKIEIEIEKR